MSLEQNVKNREKIISALHEEMIGPVRDFSRVKKIENAVVDSEKQELLYYYEYANIKEEVIFNQPQRQYNSGILYPLITSNQEIDLSEEEQLNLSFAEEESDTTNDYDGNPNSLVSENKFLPSTFGLTFAVDMEENELAIDFSCGSYEQTTGMMQSSSNNKKWWSRKSLYANTLVPLQYGHQKKEITLADAQGIENTNLKLRLDILVRPITLRSTRRRMNIVTISGTNITENTDTKNDSNLMFQCEIKVSGLNNGFEPYPSAASLEAKIEDEDKKFDLLYSSEKNYGFGQNCSVKWLEKNDKVEEICTTFLPEYEIKTMTPDIIVKGKKIEISHAEIASATDFKELKSILIPLINGYKAWYEDLKKENVLPYYHSVFQENLDEINKAILRIENGIERLSNPDILNAFRLTNLAMLMQMTSGKNSRKLIKDDGMILFDITYNNPFEELDYSSLDSLVKSIEEKLGKDEHQWKKYKWRGFQIAFLLMSLESFIDKDSKDRKIVDLIWFPTGGGKTEAYLAAATFSMLYRRIMDPTDIGTDVIMRYTLRLLTADQFQRSARLICSLEFLRRKFPILLGDSEFSLGMWVGSSNTPNKNAQARVLYNQILRKEKPGFPLSSCPWCGAEMTLTDSGIYHGFTYHNGLIAFCPDSDCVFHNRLPIYFVDEQLYKEPPTFLIGTVDKFVQLTWQSAARSFFGINSKGKRIVSPPNLIIQDELHLISGPLGTLVGMYEILIEELCTDKRRTRESSPKIICATATIKAYDNQIKSLFGREKAFLFPPSGVDINDNYFSTVQKDESGKNVPGRKYVGVYPFTQGRLQTEVQTISTLISATQSLPESERDPFWTILSFYNSINDIGKGLALSDQDIPHNLKNFYDSRKVEEELRRYPKIVKELTSRLDSKSVSSSILEMKEPYKEKDNKAIDIVLASNIVEVGIDIDRLSLMTINEQPKTSAQYIQVSGRVGRRTNERPGLVITQYNPTNSNDKSHYEHFNEFHQRLYSQVEESSVTPYSLFSIKRGLPAVIIGFLRQNFDQKRIGDAPDYQYIKEISGDINTFLKKILVRVKAIDDTEIEFLKSEAIFLMDQLMNNYYDDWEYKGGKQENNGFMVRLTKEQEDVPDNVLPVMFSMRSVDAVSSLVVTPLKSFSGNLPTEGKEDKTDGIEKKEKSNDVMRWFE